MLIDAELNTAGYRPPCSDSGDESRLQVGVAYRAFSFAALNIQ